jgi:alpha-glucosidase
MIGDRLLVCPVLQAGAEGRRVYLPEGPWYSLWDDSIVEGKKEVWVKCGLHQIPLFVKPGSVIPMYPTQQYVGEKKITQLDIHVYYTSGREENFLYEDRGDGYDYKRGYFNEKVFKVDVQSEQVRILQHRSGEYQPSYDSYKIILHGLPFTPSSITVDETESNFEHLLTEEGKPYIIVSERFKEIKLK